MEKLVRIKDSNGNRQITNDSVIQIDHYRQSLLPKVSLTEILRKGLEP